MAGAPYRMRRVEEPAAYAWQRRQQGTPSEQVRENLQEAIREKRAKEAATPNDLSADFTLRLAKAQAFAKEHGLRWEGPCTHMMAVALVEEKAARANHLIKGMAARIAALEKQLSETVTVANHTGKHALTFGGSFVLESAYNEGTLCTYKGLCYIAGRDISPNLAFPPRQGSGWIPLT